MPKRKSNGHGKRQAGKRREASPEFDVLQDRFNSMEVDFSQLAAVLGHQ